MTASIVPAITLSRSRAAHPETPRPAVPLPTPPLIMRTATTVYGVAALDCNGRIADGHVLRSLAWTSGQRLAPQLAGVSVLIVADPRGPVQIGRAGHLRLPVSLRRACHLVAGDRVLLVADPPNGKLLVHPPAALDALFPTHPAHAAGGEQR